MIDRTARDSLLILLRHLASGQVSNEEFELKAPIQSHDTAISNLRNAAWGLYSDYYEHKLAECHALEPEDQQHVARWILFLQTDSEYEWPKYGCTGIVRLVAWIISFGVVPRHFDRAWKRNGDFSVWPCLRRKDYELSLRHPKYLNT